MVLEASGSCRRNSAPYQHRMRARSSWRGSLHDGKKHGAKNKLSAEQRRLPQKLISKNASDSQQKLDAANRPIDDLKSAVAILQKSVSQLSVWKGKN
jgi:hypothetical protein